MKLARFFRTPDAAVGRKLASFRRLCPVWLCASILLLGVGRVAAADPITIDPVSDLTLLEDSTNNPVVVTNILGGGAIGVTAFSSDVGVVADPTVAFDAANAMATLTLIPVSQTTGAVTITLTLTNEVSTNISAFQVAVEPVNHAPSFDLSTNWLSISEDAGAISLAHFVSNFSLGPAHESGQTFGFSVSATHPELFSVQPQIDVDGTLTFTTATNYNGTNTLAIVMRDDGGVANGGVDSFTNAFTLAVANVYDPPLVTPLTNWVFNENTGKTNLQLLVRAVENPSVTITAISSVTDVFNVAISGSVTSTNRTLSLTTVTNQYGTGNVILVVSDALVSATNSFQVAILQINHPPTGSRISNTAINEDFTTTNFDFTVAKFRGSVSNVTVTASSYNTNVIANENLVLSGNGTNRTLTVSPSPNAFGQSAISLVFTDTNHASTTNSFVLTVRPVNDPPSFALVTNLFVVDENAGTQTFSNVIAAVSPGPASESNQTCKYVLSYANTPLFTTAPAISATGDLTFKAATNQHGFATVRVYAQDSGGTANGGKDVSATNTFYIAVRAVASPPTIAMATNVVIARDKATNLTLTITDPDNRNVKVVAQSADLNVVTVSLRGVGKTRILTLSPATITNAATTVTVTADNGLKIATNELPVAVQAVNYAPELTVLTALTINENAAATNRNFTVSDKDTSVSSLVVTAKISNTNLAAVAVSTTDFTNRVLTITPLTNMYGSATVELGVDDATGTKTAKTTQRFVLTVNPVNHAPSFSLGTNVIYASENTGATGNKDLQSVTNLIRDISSGPTNERSQAITFYATSSSNAFFVTPPSISAKGILTFKPTLYATGSVALAIYARDSGGTLNGGVNTSPTNTITLVVTNINQAPVIGTLANLTLKESSSPTNVAVTVKDVDSTLTHFHISASCNKPWLASVSATNSWQGLFITVTPASKTNSSTLVDGKPLGSATVTVSVDDGALTNSKTFTLTIGSVNDAPTFTLGGPVTATRYYVEHTVSNLISHVVLGPTSDETNQNWTAIVSISASDAKMFLKTPSIDKFGTLKFTPTTNSGIATVTVSVKDSGGVANGGQDTSLAQTFNLRVPNNPFANLAGEFNGLFLTPTNVLFDRSGFVRFTVGPAGTFSGALLSAGTSNQFSGQFDLSGAASVAVANMGLAMDLNLDLAGGSEAISGTITNPSAHWNVPLLALRSVYGTETIVPAVGDYTLLITGVGGGGATLPAGDGVLRVNVDKNGQISLGGQLADGVTVTQRVAMTRYAEWPLYLPAYGRGANGLVLSWITFTDTNSVNAVVSNKIVWFKTASAGGAIYNSGFTNSTVPVASAYYTWDGLWLNNARVILGGGNLASPITNWVDVAYDRVTVTTNNCNLKLSLDPATGWLAGTFIDPSSGKTNQINAVVMQMLQQARGYFLGTNASGYFWLK
jgi:hypothetical protein